MAGDSDEDGSPEHHAKQIEEKESVFARLEESRKMLEDELGFHRFMKVYKYIQVRENTKLFSRLLILKVFTAS